MGQQLIKGPQQITIEDSEGRGGLSIFLGQSNGDITRWRFEVWASVGDGLLLVGRFTTCAPHDNSPRTRLVATAAVPGAQSYTLRVKPAKPVAGETWLYKGEVFASVGDPGGQLPGVQRVNERPKYYAGSVAALLDIPPGERVVSWSVFSTGAGAALRVGATGDLIPIPTGAGVSGGDGGLVEGPIRFVMTGPNFGGYLIEVAESA